MNPDKTKRIGFKIRLVLHLLALALALAIPWACAIRAKPKPTEPMTFLQIPISVRPASVPDVPSPEPSIAELPEPDPIPEPAIEPIRKQEAKKPELAKKSKPVEKQTNRVTKTAATSKQLKPPEPPSEESIRKILTTGIPGSGETVISAGKGDPVLDGYYRQVFSRMYSAWIQPTQLKSLPGLSTEIRISVETDGAILDWKKTKGSGNDLMDDSVLKAVRSVKKLPPLPIGYTKPLAIAVTFVLGE